MEDLTIIDGIVIATLLISGFLAYARGIVREVLSIAGWAGADVVAFWLAPRGKDLVFEIPVISGFVGDSCNIALIISFAVIFILALIVISLFTPLLSGLISGSALGLIDKGLGFLFGLARGVLLVIVALFVYDQLIPEGEGIKIIDDSKTRVLLADSQARLATEVEGSKIPEWFIARFEDLTSTCSASGADPVLDNTVVPPASN